MTPLLDVRDLRIAATQHDRLLLKDVSFSVDRGQCLAIVGESGSGKTMASRSILGLLPPGVERTGGSIRLNGEELTELKPGKLRAVRGRDVGMVFQEPMMSLNPALTIGDQLTEGMRLHLNLDRQDIHERCLAMLERVNIHEPERCLSAFPHEFSGGMRQRIMLASVLLLKPKLLIADEPTTALDTLSQREVMELMIELARDDDVSIMLITHDLGVVTRYSQQTVVLEKGVCVESGKTGTVLSQPAHPYTRKLLASVPRRSTSRRTPIEGDAALLDIKGAVIDYPGKAGLFGVAPPKRVVHDVDLKIHQGEIVALVGASGSGKSTLGRAVVGLKPLAAGRILFDGRDITHLTAEATGAFRRDVQMVFQDPFSSLDPRMRIGDQVGAALRHIASVSPAERIERVEAILMRVGLEGYAGRLPHQISGGQRQRVAIARAVVSRPRLVVADEPVSALDVTIQRQVLDLLRSLQSEYGFACLFVTHDLGVVEQIADRVYVMLAGEIVESGGTDAVFDHPVHDYTRALIEATPSLIR